MSNLVQPIVVSAEGNHLDAVAAAATASLGGFGNDSPVYREWLSGPFTKTVRRCKAAQFERLRDAFGVYEAVSGTARAFAMDPVAYDDMPKAVRNLQVSGTEMPRGESSIDLGADYWSAVVNGSLGMSTGKTAAQVAHAFWMAGRVLNIIEVAGHEFERLLPDATYVVRDAGLTEFDGPTTTVAVMDEALGNYAIELERLLHG